MYENSENRVLIYKLLELVFLTTEQEEYAVFATTEFKEKFAKTHWCITDVSLVCFIFCFEMNLG